MIFLNWLTLFTRDGGVPHGNVTTLMSNDPTPLTNAAFALGQMSWFVN